MSVLESTEIGQSKIKKVEQRKLLDVLLKYFGCVVNSHIPSHDREKFDKKGEKNIFVGYNNESKGYRLFNPKTNKLVNSHVNKGQKD